MRILEAYAAPADGNRGMSYVPFLASCALEHAWRPRRPRRRRAEKKKPRAQDAAEPTTLRPLITFVEAAERELALDAARPREPPKRRTELAEATSEAYFSNFVAGVHAATNRSGFMLKMWVPFFQTEHHFGFYIKYCAETLFGRGDPASEATPSVLEASFNTLSVASRSASGSYPWDRGRPRSRDRGRKLVQSRVAATSTGGSFQASPGAARRTTGPA